MKLIFFGTCGGIQTRTNTNVSFLIVDGELSILVDASGNPVHYLERAGVDPRTLDILVLTHTHTDHIYALPSLIHNLWLMKREKPLSIISNQFTLIKAQELCACFSLLSKENLFQIDWVKDNLGIIELFTVDHSTPTSGFKIKSSTTAIVYSSDTSPCKRVIQEAEGAKALIHEASNTSEFEDRLNSAGHSSGRQAGEVAARAGVETLFLCHFDPQYANDSTELMVEAGISFNGKIIVPELFKTYEV